MANVRAGQPPVMIGLLTAMEKRASRSSSVCFLFFVAFFWLHCLMVVFSFIYKTTQKKNKKNLKHIHEFIHDVSVAPQVSGLVFCSCLLTRCLAHTH